MPVHQYGIPKRFLDHASRGQVLDEVGLTADAVATAIAHARLRLALPPMARTRRAWGALVAQD